VSRFRITDQARTDLDEIWAFIAADDPAAATAFVDRLIQRFRGLARLPRPMRDGIEVVRVLSRYRVLPELFGR